MSKYREFPKADADTIKEYAFEVGKPEVADLVDEVREWLGKPEKVTALATAWDPTAARMVRDAGESLGTCQRQLADYWEGRAHEAFSGWASDIDADIESTAAILSGMSNLLQDCNDVITRTYMLAIGAIGETAAAILEAVGGLFGTIKDKFGMLGEVAKLLAGFVRTITNLSQGAVEQIGDYRRFALDMRQKAAELNVMDRIPPSAELPENWEVRPA
ncbi:MAG: WXG100 family type VII secretion target [Pseudonocardiaceae bacterium]